MTNEISRPGSRHLRVRKDFLFLFVVVAMACGAFGASVASAHGVTAHAASKAKYTSTKKLSGVKSGKPTLSVSISSEVKGGEPITKVGVTLPKGFSWVKSHAKKDVSVKGHSVTRSVKGRTLTIKLKTAAKKLTIKAKKGAIKETKKARSSKAGKVKLSVTEEKAKTTVSPNALVSALTSIESQLNSGQSQVETAINSGVSQLESQCPTVVGELDTQLATNASSLQVSDSLLELYDGFLLSSLPVLQDGYGSLSKLLVSLGYNSNAPLTSAESILGLTGSAVGLNSSEFCTDLGDILTSDPESTLQSLEKALEGQINTYAGDLMDYQAGLTKLEATLEGAAAAGQGLVSPTQLTTIETAIEGISTDLQSALGGASGGSNPISTALSSLLSTLGLSSLLPGDPLSELTTLLSSGGSDPLSGLTSLLGLLGGSSI